MNDALRRHEEILRVIRGDAIHSQEELLALLRRKGFRVTQPTLSRDLRALGIAKTPAGYVDPSTLGPSNVTSFVAPAQREGQFEQLVDEFVVGVAQSGTLAVVKTPPAGAPPVARAIDEAGLDGVIGCIAGDDAVFVALVSSSAARALVQRIERLLTPSKRRGRRG